MVPTLLFLLFAWAFVTSSANNFFTVTLKTDPNSRYVVPADMGLGSNTQTLQLALSMGTPYLSVAGTNCSTCNGSSPYIQAKSNTAQSLPGSGNFSLLGSNSAVGGLISEDCRLPTINGSAWNYPNQTILVIDQSSNLLNSEVSGIFGLQVGQSGSALFNSSIIGSEFVRDPARQSLTYGLALQPPTPQSTAAGQLHWFAPDPSAYSGSITTKNVTNVTSPASSSAGIPSPLLAFDIDSWAVSIGGAALNTIPVSTMIASLDPYYPSLYFPANQTALIYAAINGSTSSLGDNGQSTVWNIPCGTVFDLTIVIGGTSYTLDQTHLIQQSPGGSCTSYIRGWSDPTIQQYLFGSVFMSTVYVIVQVTNPSTGQPASLGFATRTTSSSSSTNVGAIVGGVIGGVAFLAVIAVGIFLFMRKDKQRRPGVVGKFHLNDKHVTVLPTVLQHEPIGTQNQPEAYHESVLQSPHDPPYLPPSYHQSLSVHN